MKRTIIKIDEEKCNGCGLCVEGCHEGALQIIDKKARMISDLFCDGLGACIGECPEGAITLEEREAEPYDEIAVMKKIALKGSNTVLAHLKHLKDHNEHKYLSIAIDYINDNKINIDLSLLNKKQKLFNIMENQTYSSCPGSKSMDFRNLSDSDSFHPSDDMPSALNQWPVQLHLVNPQAPYFENADVLLAADCVAFSLGNFHTKYLKGKSLAIACPKLDSNMEIYVEKLQTMIDHAEINTLTVMIMEVPCCGGLLQMAKMAIKNAIRKIPIKLIVVGIRGEIKNEQWVFDEKQ
ncbi:4Fe-4S ferredoxin [bacterium]|nr:MAG: 4Fe-4S ferredoxin [bacterium]